MTGRVAIVCPGLAAGEHGGVERVALWMSRCLDAEGSFTPDCLHRHHVQRFPKRAHHQTQYVAARRQINGHGGPRRMFRPSLRCELRRDRGGSLSSQQGLVPVSRNFRPHPDRGRRASVRRSRRANQSAGMSSSGNDRGGRARDRTQDAASTLGLPAVEHLVDRLFRTTRTGARGPHFL